MSYDLERKSVEKPARKRKFGERFASSKTTGLNPHREMRVLEIVIQSCSRIEELEIGIFCLTAETICRIDGEELSHISQCKLLKKLTLANFNITDGVFFEEVVVIFLEMHEKRLAIKSIFHA